MLKFNFDKKHDSPGDMFIGQRFDIIERMQVKRGVFLGLSAALLSTFSVIINRHTFSNYEIHPLVYSSSVMASAGLNSLVFLSYRKGFISLSDSPKVKHLFINGLGGLIANVLFIWGLQSTSSVNATFLASGVMISTAIVARLLNYDRYNKVQIFWFSIMFIGIYIAVVGVQRFSINKGDYLILLSLPIYGFTIVYGKYLTKSFTSDVIAGYRFMISGVAAVIVVGLFLRNDLLQIQMEVFIWAYLAGTVFWLSIQAFYLSLKAVGPNLSRVMDRMAIIFTILLAPILLGESINSLDLISATAIILCVVMLQRAGRPAEKLSSSKSRLPLTKRL